MSRGNSVKIDEVIFHQWFKSNYHKLGFDRIIKHYPKGFPDFIMEIDNEEIRVELEILSRGFIEHKHDPSKVDLVVCIEMNEELSVPCISVNPLLMEINDAVGNRKIINKVLKSIQYKTSGNEYYLFNWKKITKPSRLMMIKFLKETFNIEWVENSLFEISENEDIIKIYTEKNFLFLKLIDAETKVKIELDDGRTEELNVKTESPYNLNVYASTSHNLVRSKEIIKKINQACLLSEYPNFMEKFFEEITSIYLYLEEIEKTGSKISSIDVKINIFSEENPRDVITKDVHKIFWPHNIFHLKWDNIPGDDSKKFIIFLHTLGIKGLNDVTVEKSEDNKRIVVSNSNKYILSINIKEDNSNAILETFNGKKLKIPLTIKDNKIEIYSYVRLL